MIANDDALLKRLYKYLLIAYTVFAGFIAIVTGSERGWIIVACNFLIAMSPVYLLGVLFLTSLIMLRLHQENLPTDEKNKNRGFLAIYWSWQVGNVLILVSLVLALVPYLGLIIYLGSIGHG
jgi:biotin transporter BioY